MSHTYRAVLAGLTGIGSGRIQESGGSPVYRPMPGSHAAAYHEHPRTELVAVCDLRQEAIDELWRCAGSDFDAELVQALVAVLPDIHLPDVPTPVDRLHLVSSGQGSGIEVSSWERAD